MTLEIDIEVAREVLLEALVSAQRKRDAALADYHEDHDALAKAQQASIASADVLALAEQRVKRIEEAYRLAAQ